jgi:signal peptidase I
MSISYEDELKKSGKILFTIKGVSMRPLFRTADDAIFVVTCNPEELKNLDIVLFNRVSQTMGEQYVLHRIVGRRKDGQFIVVGDNCTYFDLVDPKDILGVVKSAQRGNKPIKLTGFKYSLYKYLWCKPYKFRFLMFRVRNKIRIEGSKIKRFIKKILHKG